MLHVFEVGDIVRDAYAGGVPSRGVVIHSNNNDACVIVCFDITHPQNEKPLFRTIDLWIDEKRLIFERKLSLEEQLTHDREEVRANGLLLSNRKIEYV